MKLIRKKSSITVRNTCPMESLTARHPVFNWVNTSASCLCSNFNLHFHYNFRRSHLNVFLQLKPLKFNVLLLICWCNGSDPGLVFCPPQLLLTHTSVSIFPH